jgi:hypothetical protein
MTDEAFTAMATALVQAELDDIEADILDHEHTLSHLEPSAPPTRKEPSMPVVPPKVDLRALIQDRKTKNARPTIRATICFDPDLLERLAEAKAEEKAKPPFTADKPDPDPRLGKKTTLADDIVLLEADVAAASAVAVFRVPTRERQAEINKLAEDGEDVDATLISECFQHFLNGNEPMTADQLGRADLDDWLTVASRGEVNDISYRIAARSLGTPDFPPSVKRSLANRR